MDADCEWSPVDQAVCCLSLAGTQLTAVHCCCSLLTRCDSASSTTCLRHHHTHDVHYTQTSFVTGDNKTAGNTWLARGIIIIIIIIIVTRTIFIVLSS